MIREFEERAEELGHSSLVKEAARSEMGLRLQLEYLNPTCIKHDCGEVITAEKLKAELRRGLEQKTWEAVREHSWQGKLTSTRSEDKGLFGGEGVRKLAFQLMGVRLCFKRQNGHETRLI